MLMCQPLSCEVLAGLGIAGFPGVIHTFSIFAIVAYVTCILSSLSRRKNNHWVARRLWRAQ